MKQTIQIGKITIRADFGFIAVLLVLFATSCFALYNSFNFISVGSGRSYLIRQTMFYILGFILLFLMSRLQNKVIFSWIDPVYKFLNLCLIYLLVSKFLNRFTGYTLPLTSDINGAFSWFQIPLLGSFQPSEYMKVILILKTSQIISNYQARHPKPTVRQDLQMLFEILKVCFFPMIMVLLQPDTGVFIIMAFTLLVLILCSGVRKSYLYIILGLVILAFGGFFYLYFYQHELLASFVSQYQLNRIEAWLNPEDHILGSSNQLYTALLSLGSAGLTGFGLQANIIAIPEAHTDFIFAAFGQCFGLIGTVFIVLVCLLLDLYLCKMAYNCTRRKDRLIIIGTIAMLFYQQFQNMGMIVGLVPITGITLPLISYGGSSILSYFLIFGIILNISPVSRKTHRFSLRRARKSASSRTAKSSKTDLKTV